MRKRVYCLYRVSTIGQVEKDDIPMQKQKCREFALEKGWKVEKEFTEKGVSGFKVSAKDRDAVQEIQRDAVEGKFDILLVFMFDRLGRREDETPFVVEWFVSNGIEVWSTMEGQQRFDNHVDKLLNYIRYWQASGESVKTSMRTKTRLAQIVLEGRFRGGQCPYGYELVKNGRLGKKNKELYDLQVNPAEAQAVKLIFDLCINHGYGGRRIASVLTEQGYRTHSGDSFHYSTIQNILKNVLYTGVLRSGETKSEVFPELQIISEDTFQRAQCVMEQRSSRFQELRDAPRVTIGNALLSGNIFCGHCGGRMFATTALKNHRVNDGVRMPIYRCYNRSQHRELCDGQSTYVAYKIDNAIRSMILEILQNARGIDKREFIDAKFKEQMDGMTAQLKGFQTTRAKKAKELEKLDSLMLDAALGEGPFTVERLTRRMDSVEKELDELDTAIGDLNGKLKESTALINKLREQYQQLLTWSDIFEGADIEVQKMVAAYLIKRVTVSRGYELQVEFNIDERQFLTGLEEQAM